MSSVMKRISKGSEDILLQLRSRDTKLNEAISVEDVLQLNFHHTLEWHLMFLTFGQKIDLVVTQTQGPELIQVAESRR